MIRTAKSFNPEVSAKQVAFFVVGWPDSVPSARRNSFDVSATMYYNEAEAKAYADTTVLSVFTFYADSAAEVDEFFQQHCEARRRHRVNLGYPG